MNVVYLPHEVDFCGEHIPIEEPFVAKKLKNTIYNFIRYKHDKVQDYVKQLHGYENYLDSVFAANSLCLDLKYVPVIESEFDADARSWVGAVGPWQIMPRTASDLGLKVNHYIDERKNFEKATAAAVRYFKRPENEFSGYCLKIAAYDAGNDGVRAAMKRSSDSSYFHLVFLKKDGSINDEPMDYCYKAIAVKIILEHLEDYHFHDGSPEEVGIVFRDYRLTRPKKIAEVAKDLNLSPAEFVFYNREFKQFKDGTLSPGNYRISIPSKKN